MKFYVRYFIGLLTSYAVLRLILPYFEPHVSKKGEENYLSAEPTIVVISHLVHAGSDTFIRNFSEETEEIYYRRRPFVVEPYFYNVMIIPKEACDESTSVVILVHSFHTKTAVREAIRTTWGSVARSPNPYWPSLGHLNHTLRLYFVLGIHKDHGLNDLMIEENAKHGDIIMGNFYDSYANMTLKSLLGLKFLVEFCNFPRFLIKSDDDMFLNLPGILNFLQEIPFSRFITGPLCVHSKVYRTGKWKLSKEEFPFDHYPPYYAGSTYIISRDLWQELFNLSFYVPRIHIDDVYITGILAEILNVTKVKRDGFAFWNSRPASICDIKTSKVLTSTKMKVEDMQNIWKSLTDNSDCLTTIPS